MGHSDNIVKIREMLKYRFRQARHSLFPFFYYTSGLRFPKHLSTTYKEALNHISSIYPDKGETCLCTNKIIADHDLHIIIPVYNTATYLRDCLNSVLSQESGYDVFISIINDGSTDNSHQILDNICTYIQGTALGDNIEVIHQDNQGLSCARNRGLNNIRGKYIMFVDSDDMLLPNAIDTLMAAAIKNGADIAEGNFNTGSTYGCACGKVYSSCLFQHVHFPPGYLFEDTLNIFYLYPLSQKTVQVSGVHYFYRANPSSIMHSFQGSTRAIDSLWVSQRILKDYFSTGNTATRQLFLDYIKDTLSTTSHLRTLGNERVLQSFFIIITHTAKKYFNEYLQNNDVINRLSSTSKILIRSINQNDYRLYRTAIV